MRRLLFLLLLLRQFVTDVWIFRLLLLRHCSDHRVLCQLVIQTLLQRLVDTAKAAGLTVAPAADALTVPDFVFAGW